MRKKPVPPTLCLMLTIPVLWLAVIAASVYENGINVFELVSRLTSAVNHPFAVRWTAYTPRFLLAFLLLYGGGVLLYYSGRENRRPGQEYGSAQWGSPWQLNKKYADKDFTNNTLLTRHVAMSLNGRQHMRNLLQIIVGGSGAGKTRFFCKPNIMQANGSFLVTDPKGEMLRALAPLLLEEGYVLRVFDLIDPQHSDAFNPFSYIRDAKDVMKLVNNLIQNTTPKNAQQSDPFWERSEVALDTALMLYLLYEAPPEEQNFETVLYMLENGGASEEDESYRSPLDLLFEALEDEEPDHIAVREYHIFQQAAGKTARSILITAAVRLSAFIIPQIRDITSQDEMELSMMGERKQAVFAVIPDSDSTFNYLVGMLYTCAFQSLYHAKNETAFSALTPVEMARLSIVDRIPEDTVEFHIRGYTVAVENAALGQAIAVLPVRLRDVALLYYFAGMSDPQIGQLLRLKPDTVQHRRAASLTKLRKLLGGSYGQ